MVVIKNILRESLDALLTMSDVSFNSISATNRIQVLKDNFVVVHDG